MVEKKLTTTIKTVSRMGIMLFRLPCQRCDKSSPTPSENDHVSQWICIYYKWHSMYSSHSFTFIHVWEIAESPFLCIFEFQISPRQEIRELSSIARFHLIVIQNHSLFIGKLPRVKIYPFFSYISVASLSSIRATRSLPSNPIRLSEDTMILAMAFRDSSYSFQRN